MNNCRCEVQHMPRRIVLTGGPGAGKTAVLELARQAFCAHVVVVPEAASLLFKGGFPRGSSEAQRQAAQRAMYFVQRELECSAAADRNPAVLLCDRGTLDGLAYWPGDPALFWENAHSSCQEQLARYDVIIHLRTPSAGNGYNHQNPARIESAVEAADIDARIGQVWSAHPRRFEVPSTPGFLEKASRTLALIQQELPACCRPPLMGALEISSAAVENAHTAPEMGDVAPQLHLPRV